MSLPSERDRHRGDRPAQDQASGRTGRNPMLRRLTTTWQPTNALQQERSTFRLSTEEGTRKAIEFYDEAIRLDPNYALAHANLSLAWRLLGAAWLGGGAEAKEAYARRGMRLKSPCRSRQSRHCARSARLRIIDL